MSQSKESSHRTLSNEKVMHITFFLLCAIPLAASIFITTDGVLSTVKFFGFEFPLRGICFFRFFTGYKCPVCGMTRCFTYISHGNIAAAWHYSHAGIPLYILCVYESLYRLAFLIFGGIMRRKPFVIAEITLLVIACTATAFFFVIQFFCPLLA
jgi:hypothetical protein